MELDDLHFLTGMLETYRLHKSGQHVALDAKHVFPLQQQQASWKFKSTPTHFHMTDGSKVFSFVTPEGQEGDEFMLHQAQPEHNLTFSEEGSGYAQVHRSDPGSIYFTMQKGKENPTYTLRHVADNKWKAIKKSKKSKVKLENKLTDTLNTQQKVEASESTGNLQNSEKAANDYFESINKALGSLVTDGINASHSAAMLPSRNPLVAGAAGATTGLLYHLLRRELYNTPEENLIEDEEGIKPLLKRVGLPALALGGLGFVENQAIPGYNDPGSIKYRQKLILDAPKPTQPAKQP